MANELTPQDLTEFVKNKVFKTPVDLSKNITQTPYMYKKGDRVNYLNPDYKADDIYEVLGFYNQGNVIDENTASPYNKSYGVRIKNISSGQEYPTTANWLKLIEGGK